MGASKGWTKRVSQVGCGLEPRARRKEPGWAQGGSQAGCGLEPRAGRKEPRSGKARQVGAVGSGLGYCHI